MLGARFRNSYSVGTPSSSTTFQLSYFVEVAIFDVDSGVEYPGTLTFTFEVVSPTWIAEFLGTDKILLGRHFIVSNTSDLSKVEAKLTKYLDAFRGGTAKELVEKLEKVARSESAVEYPLAETFFL